VRNVVLVKNNSTDYELTNTIMSYNRNLKHIFHQDRPVKYKTDLFNDGVRRVAIKSTLLL